MECSFAAFSQIKERRQKMNDLLILLLILAVWIFLQSWLLPRMGVSTCMREACPVKGREKKPEVEGNQERS
jgi:hypothetical protein